MEDCLKVPLSSGSFAHISDCDAETVLAHKWQQSGRYAMAKIGGKTVYMHRLILGAKAGEYVDHWNNDGLDNRRENIRICTQSQNAGAKIVHAASSTTGIRGIHKHGRKWRVIAGRNERGSVNYIGSFTTLEEAVAARETAAADRWGEFARNG